MKKYKVGISKTISFQGLEIIKTKVEAQILPGIPGFTIVGLADKSIHEAKERVRAALVNIGINLSNKIIINLSPASSHKEGTHYDLPILFAILSAINKIDIPLELIFFSELGLEGNLVPTHGVLPCAIFSSKNNYTLVLSKDDESKIEFLPSNLKCIISDNILELIEKLKNKEYKLLGTRFEIKQNKTPSRLIKGQEIAKRALAISAAGRHHLLMIGQHGVGKSTLAHAIKEILPPLSKEESLEVTSIYSIAGLLKEWIFFPPFRAPHSSSSLHSIIGGGTTPKPGEISLSHYGVLFLDELPEFSPKIIDALRTPLEENKVHISRSNHKTTYPSDIQLIISMNPCKCGLFLQSRCRCRERDQYIKKIPGPILDRIDLHIPLNALNNDDKTTKIPNIDKILKARKKQQERFDSVNGKVDQDLLIKKGRFSKEVIETCENKISAESMRSFWKLLRISRTIADLEDAEEVQLKHLYEAMVYRKPEFKG